MGVIIGDDMRFESGEIITDSSKRARSDASLKGIKKMARNEPERAARIADEVVRNTYRVLMTRGMRGCYVFCTDSALTEHLRESAPHGYRLSDSPIPYAAEDNPKG